MSSPAPSSRPSTGRYHHGDLRNGLLGAAMGLLESEGLEAVSLRAVARAAGVSHAAPYHHFADKAALVEALAARGFDQLSEQMRQAMEQQRAPLDRFRATGLAYGRFAQQHPALLRLMIRSELRDGASVADAARACLDVVADAVRSAQAAGQMVAGDPVRLARVAWATVHGAVLLRLDGLIDLAGVAGDEDPIDEATEVLALGFVPRADGPVQVFEPLRTGEAGRGA